jgi:uncharacterized protein with ParB-like and HNH nuclease domain
MYERTKIVREVYTMSLRELVRQVQEGCFDSNPSYQRGLVWSLEQKKKLIDSILWGIALPSIYLRDKGYSTHVWAEVVDGKQRLNALVEFVEGRFDYNGEYFPDLPDVEKRCFLMDNTIGIVLVKQTTDEEVVELYERLNFCGVPHERGASKGK